jgi:hypothetical protein
MLHKRFERCTFENVVRGWPLVDCMAWNHGGCPVLRCHFWDRFIRSRVKTVTTERIPEVLQTVFAVFTFDWQRSTGCEDA